jgi:hypothetical protein
MEAKDRRGSPRETTLKDGSIIFGGAPPVDCVIRNMSDSGAGIEVRNTIAVPDTFQLLIRPELVKRHCRVVWRKHGWIGVQFF